MGRQSKLRLHQSVRQRFGRESLGGLVLLSPMDFSSPVLSPSCFTPIVQHFDGGLEDIFGGWRGSFQFFGVWMKN